MQFDLETLIKKTNKKLIGKLQFSRFIRIFHAKFHIHEVLLLKTVHMEKELRTDIELISVNFLNS